jgi:hypothetical protein
LMPPTSQAHRQVRQGDHIVRPAPTVSSM